MKWSELQSGHVLISKRTERVHLILKVWRPRGGLVAFDFFSLTTQRAGGSIAGGSLEIDEYDVLKSGESG